MSKQVENIDERCFKLENAPKAAGVKALTPLEDLPPNQVLTLKVAIEYMGITEKTFYNDPMRYPGFFKQNGRWVIKVKDLQELTNG